MKTILLQFLLVACAAVCSGQESVLKGIVRTYEDAVVPSTKVTATDANGKEFGGSADQNGDYELKLKPGTYQILFEREGFTKSLYTNVTFDPKKSDRLDARLSPSRCFDCDEKEQWDYYGVIAGTVYDPLGAVIPGAKVTIRGDDGISRVVNSNRDGTYESRIVKGENRIVIEAKNFETVIFEKYRAVRSYKGKIYLDVSMAPKLLRDKDK